MPDGPQLGAVEDGYRFKGGDPSQQSSWEPEGQASQEKPGFFSSLGSSLGNTIKGQAQSWMHGGGAIAEDSPGQPVFAGPEKPVLGGLLGTSRNTVGFERPPGTPDPGTFNPFSPVKTAGYLVPQPIKDIAHKIEGGNVSGAAGQAVGETLPYATSGIAPENVPSTLAAPVRGAAKTLNAGIRHAEPIGAGLGAIGGLAKGATYGEPLYGGLIGGYIGERLGKFVQRRMPQVPGENLGLPNPAPLPLSEGGTVSRGSTVSPPMGLPKVPGEAGGTISGISQVNPPVAQAAPKMSVLDQISAAKNLGFPNLGAAIQKIGQEGWNRIINSEPPSTASVGPIGKPTPFATTDYEPWGGQFASTDLDRMGQKAAKENFYAQAPEIKTKTQLTNEAKPGVENEKPKPSIVAKSEKRK